MTLSEAVGKRIRSIIEIPELKKRVTFTLLMFLVARIGVHIILPGIDADALASSTDSNSFLDVIDTFSGGALLQASIFSLGIIPYINASIVFQLLTVVIPKLEEMQKEGGKSQQQLNQWTRYLTIIIATIQGFGLSIMFRTYMTPGISPLMFSISTMIIIAGSTAFLMWIAEQITLKGIGNGTSLLIFLSIVSRIPSAFSTIATSGGSINWALLILAVVIFIILIMVIVCVQLAERRVPVQYVGKGASGKNMSLGQKSFLPLKINMVGVMPIIFASVLMAAPNFLINAFIKDTVLKNKFLQYFSGTSPIYLGLFFLVVVFFTFFYTSIMFDPVKMSENLKLGGATIPGIRPGSETADYLESVVTKITWGSAIFLGVLAILPNVIFGLLNMPVLLSGTGLLILVGVAVNTVQQIDSHLAVRSYKGFISK